MKCPHCGETVKSQQQVWQERQVARGRCLTCGVEKSETDAKHLKCRGCRVKTAAAQSRRRAARRQRGAIAS